MALTQTDIDRLEAAIASPEKSVTLSDGRRVEWRTVDEFKAQLAYVKEQVDAASAAGAVSVSVAGFSRD